MAAQLTFTAKRSDGAVVLNPPGMHLRVTDKLTIAIDASDLLNDDETISSVSTATKSVPGGASITFDDAATIDDESLEQILDGSKLTAGSSYLLSAEVTTDDAAVWTIPLVLTVPIVAASAIATTDDLDNLLGLNGAIDATRGQLVLDLATDLCESVVAMLPPAARVVVLSVAGRAYLNPSGIAQQSIGPESVSYGSAIGGVYLTRRDVFTLRRLAGLTGAFSVDVTPVDAMKHYQEELSGLDLETAEQIILDFPAL